MGFKDEVVKVGSRTEISIRMVDDAQVLESVVVTALGMKRDEKSLSTRQALAHPMSEFLGTVLIAIVLGFGGAIILSEKAWFDAPTFIFYMVILYSVINPLKDFAKAGYNIPKGMASMERVNKDICLS